MKENIENNIYERIREKVFFYATYQKRTEAEIRQKVLPLFEKYNIPQDTLSDLIEELKEKGYIDDVDFVKKKFKSYINLKKSSVKEIEYKLLQKGIAKEDIDSYKEINKERLYQHEIEAAKRLYEKQISNKSDEEARLYLRRKGFSLDIVNKI